MSKETAERYGYHEENLSLTRAEWKNDGTVPQRLTRLPEALDFDKKFRAVIDYDPEFERTLVQIFTD